MNNVLDIAKKAAVRAGVLAVSLLGKTESEPKGCSYNLVTPADRRAEEAIVEYLHRKMPGCAVLSEESHQGTDLAQERLWIIDPIDGTTNFAHAVPHFGVSIAFAEKGKVVAGVVYDPMRKELFSASLGGGAFCNDRRIHVSGSASLSESLIATGFYYDRSETMVKTLRALRELFLKEIHCMRRLGAAALDLAWLAAGRYDGYFEYSLSTWDFAAGLFILQEAGGMASDSAGRKADLFSKGLICSNGPIHEALLACTLDPRPF